METKKNIGEAKIVGQPKVPFRFKLKDGCVKSNHLAEESVATGNIQNAAVSTEKIMDEAVTNAKIMNGAITNSKISNGTITNEKIANHSIDNSKIQNLTLTGDKFTDNSIDGSKIKDNSVPGSKLADGAIESIDLQDNTLSGSKLADNSVDGDKLVDGAVTSEKLKDNSIDGSKIADGTIQSLDIKDGSISGSKLVDNSIPGTKLSDGIITNNKIADNSITGDKFLDESISGEKIASNTIHGRKLEDNTVDGADIIEGTLNGSKIADMSIDGDKLADDSIETRHIKSNTISGSKIVTNSIDSTKIRNNSLIGENFEDGAITNAKIVDDAVTNSKIANNTIASDKIADGAITTVKLANNSVGGASIADNAITNDKLQDGSIVNRNIATGTLTGDKFVDNTITGDKIIDNTLPGSKIKDGTIENVDIKDGTLSGAKLINNSVDGAKLADNSITSSHLIDNSIPGSKIKDGTIENVDIKDGTLDGSKLKDNTITGAKLADNAITSAKLPDNIITTDKIANSAITSDKIDDGAVITDKIADLNVTTAKIADSAVTEDKLTDGSITMAKLADDTISKMETITDVTPTEGSVKPIQSGGVQVALMNRAIVGDIVGDPAQAWEPGTVEAYIDQKIAEQNAVLNAKMSRQDAVIHTLNGQDIVIVSALPQTGETNKIYRLTGTDSYTDYMWDTSLATPAFTDIATYSFPGIDDEPTANSQKLVKSGGIYSELALGAVYDISAHHNNTSYTDLAAALGTNGNNIPQGLRKGGMSVKFVQSSDNKYVQYRLMKSTWSTAISDWQGVDRVLVNNSMNLAETDGVMVAIHDFTSYGDDVTSQIGAWTNGNNTSYAELYLDEGGHNGLFHCKKASAQSQRIGLGCTNLVDGKFYRLHFKIEISDGNTVGSLGGMTSRAATWTQLKDVYGNGIYLYNGIIVDTIVEKTSDWSYLVWQHRSSQTHTYPFDVSISEFKVSEYIAVNESLDYPQYNKKSLITSDGAAKADNNIILFGKNDTIFSNTIQGVKAGNKYRIWVKNPAIDMSGVTERRSNYNRFAIGTKSSPDSSATYLVQVGCDTIGVSDLNNYYDVTIPSGATMLGVSMRATQDAEQVCMVEDITYLQGSIAETKNIFDAEINHDISIYASGAKATIVGDGNTYVYSDLFSLSGRVYKFIVRDTSIPFVGSESQIKFAIYSIDADNNSTRLITVNVGDALNKEYIVVIPSDSVNIRLGGRVQSGYSLVCDVVDVSEEYEIRSLTADDIDRYKSSQTSGYNRADFLIDKDSLLLVQLKTGNSFSYQVNGIVFDESHAITNTITQAWGSDSNICILNNYDYYRIQLHKSSSLTREDVAGFFSNAEVLIATKKTEIVAINSKNVLPLFGLTVSSYIASTDFIAKPKQKTKVLIKMPEWLKVRFYYGLREDRHYTNYYYNGDVAELDFLGGFSTKITRIDSAYSELRSVTLMPNNGTIAFEIQDSEDGSIIERNFDSEKYLGAIRATPGVSADIPMIVHVSDIHGDGIRFSSAYDYADYIGARIVINTGDNPYYKMIDGTLFNKEVVFAHRTDYATCLGNHDTYDSSVADIYNKHIAPFAGEYGFHKLTDDDVTDECYYYKDLAEWNLRIIALDIYEDVLTSNYMARISQTQIEWFIDTLNATPEGYGVLVILHQAPHKVIDAIEGKTNFNDTTMDSQLNAIDSDYMTNSKLTGNPLGKIIDAFISRGTVSDSYSQEAADKTTPETISYSADFSNVAEGAEFIAYLNGHCHRDFVGYVGDCTYKQLNLNVASTSPFSQSSGLKSPCDIMRDGNGSNQDAFNVYTINRTDKTVGIARIGSNLSKDMRDRKAMIVSYADEI